MLTTSGLARHPARDPFLDAPLAGINRRELLIDRLDWIDGWPTVNAGAWASEDAQQAPVAEHTVGGAFEPGRVGRGAPEGWRTAGSSPAGWQVDEEADAGSYVQRISRLPQPGYLLSAEDAPADVRAEGDLRNSSRAGAIGLVVAWDDEDDHTVAWLDASADALVTDVVVGGVSTGAVETPLPEWFRYDTWHNVAVEVRGAAMTVEVTSARMGDPVAVQTRALPAGVDGAGAVGVASRGTRADAVNVGAVALHQPVTEAVPDPERGELDPAGSDEFDGDELPGTTPGSPWSWVRQPEGSVEGGEFVWPTRGDLFREFNDASVLLRDAPDGDYTIETRLTFDGDRPSQQAGLIAYADDDRYVKLVNVVNGGGADVDGFLYQTEFAKEIMPNAYGLMFVGTPAETMWLRLVHVSTRRTASTSTAPRPAATARGGPTAACGRCPPTPSCASGSSP